MSVSHVWQLTIYKADKKIWLQNMTQMFDLNVGGREKELTIIFFPFYGLDLVLNESKQEKKEKFLD